jgi:hypothetical protein
METTNEVLALLREVAALLILPGPGEFGKAVRPLRVETAERAAALLARTGIYTEAEWTETHRNYEGDGSIRPALLLVEWDDPNETPSKAITRLNREVMDLVAEG